MAITDHYNMSREAQQVVREYWGASRRYKRDDHAFLADMRILQAELIRVHFDNMDGQTQARAMRTLAWLEC